jgi:sodium pump decarboxylase gamma subunit
MGVTELLNQLANPETIKTLSFVDKMLGGLLVTMLGMGVTFISLIILQVIISLLARLSAQPSRQTALQPAPHIVTSGQQPLPATNNDELVAAITAAITMYSPHSRGNIRIRNIRRIETQAPTWKRVGMLDQVNSRF